MASSDSLYGLMNFLKQKPWKECFQEIMGEHFGLFLEETGMEFNDLTDCFGEQWPMTLWGCAFEDFMTEEFNVPEINVVDHYLKTAGKSEPAAAKAYMMALRYSTMSLYEVSNVVPGVSFQARDLLRGGDAFLVHEKRATRNITQWDKIATRMIAEGNKTVMTGGSIPFDLQATDMLLEAIEATLPRKASKKLDDKTLKLAAPLFTNIWLYQTYQKITQPSEMRNTDNEPLEFHELMFPLAKGITQKTIAARLKTQPELEQIDSKFWKWCKFAAKKRQKLLDDDTVFIADIELYGRNLFVTTNSASRAEKVTSMIEQILDDLVGAPHITKSTVEEMLENHKNDPHPVENDIPADELERIKQEFMHTHYRTVLDQPIAMLGNKTPREAARSSAGKKKTADWLKHLENSNPPHALQGAHMPFYDFGWMWDELDIAHLRQ